MLIGQNFERLDGRAKVTGTAQYVDDLRPEGCLYGATVRSTEAHARIEGLELDPHFDWSDVVFATAADIPGENVVPLNTDDQPALAARLVRHVAEPIALVAAPSRDKALEAVKHVHVRYSPLPPLLDPEVSEGHAIRIFGEDNVFSRSKVQHGDAAKALAEAELVIEGTYRVGHQEQLYIEPQGLIALPRDDGGLTILGSMQCPYYIHKALKRFLGHERYNVVQTTTGGAFGGKEDYPSIMACHVALLAVKSGRPVKLIYRRDEDLLATTKRHPCVLHYRTAVERATGKLLAADIKLIFDGGAYNTLSPVVNSRGALHAVGSYYCPNVRVEAVMVATHTPPNGAFRGFGAPQSQFAAERHLDRIARTLGLDPLAVREVNRYREGQETPTGMVLKNPLAGEVLARAKAFMAAHPKEEVAAPARPGDGGQAAKLVRARGLSLGWHGAGFTGNGEARLKAKADVALEGQDVVIYIGSIDMGQGTDTIFPAIVAETLGLPLDRVRCAPHDTGSVPDSGPTAASRSVMVVGKVTQNAALGLFEALKAELNDPHASFAELAARRTDPRPLRVRAEYQDDGAVWDAATNRGDAYPGYAWTAVVVDLDVDRTTGEVFYRRFYQATDVGRAMNPLMLAGQLEGGILQALGWATCEEVVRDARGAMKNNRLTNYIIPTALDAPEMVTEIVETPFHAGPFGAKGVGELPHDVPASAVAQALESALGIVLDALPMTPERVLAALESKDAN